MEKEKRPPWWKFRARIEHDILKTTYNEIQARILPKDEAEKFDVELPVTWREQPVQWLLRALGKKELPKGSGAGYVKSPF